METFDDLGTYPDVGQKVRTTNRLMGTEGMGVVQKHLDARRSSVFGTVKSIVGGHGGDVWFVQHKDGAVAAYSIVEMGPAKTAKVKSKSKSN